MIQNDYTSLKSVAWKLQYAGILLQFVSGLLLFLGILGGFTMSVSGRMELVVTIIVAGIGVAGSVYAYGLLLRAGGEAMLALGEIAVNTRVPIAESAEASSLSKKENAAYSMLNEIRLRPLG